MCFLGSCNRFFIGIKHLQGLDQFFFSTQPVGGEFFWTNDQMESRSYQPEKQHCWPCQEWHWKPPTSTNTSAGKHIAFLAHREILKQSPKGKWLQHWRSTESIESWKVTLYSQPLDRGSITPNLLYLHLFDFNNPCETTRPTPCCIRSLPMLPMSRLDFCGSVRRLHRSCEAAA